MKILFTGGGTAGHIFPIIAVLREIKKKCQSENIRFFYIGPKDEFSETLLSQEGVEVKIILAGKFRRYFGAASFFQNVIDVFKIPIGFFQSLFYLFTISPDLIFSKGGYGSLPVVLSGWLLLVPVFLHESDLAPGLANRLLSRFSLEIFVSFPIEKMAYFPPKKMISVGNPVRIELLEGTEEKAKELLKLTGEKPVLLILGGSQGSQKINDTILAILPELLQNFELIHQAGEKNLKQIEAESKIVIEKNLQAYYHLFPFLKEEELKAAFAVANLVISRAGSGSIFEISAAGKASVLIPLPESAQDHQLKNANTYAQSGACLVIEEANLTPHFFFERIKHLFSQPEELKEMKEGARAFSRPQSAKIIAEYIIEYLAA
jgi:UDP-N-acetylglucosamine--N-acetylmuramyl-(pentapeptide) pyrophosphoryl-undecaprenol N-acetylglucosamine transferase